MARTLEDLVERELGRLAWMVLRKQAECELLHETIKKLEAERDALKKPVEAS